jgi:23S rRNA pseudouridine1911/1915/1917 synthase
VVAELYAPGADGWEMLRRSFGQRFVPDESGPVDKKALLEAMQSSPEVRAAVQDLIHPLVEHSWLEFCACHDTARVVLAEVPLLFEGKWKDRGLVDVTVNVHTPAGIRHRRLADNRGWSPEIIAQMQAWQMADQDKARMADLNVSNAGSWAELERAAADLRRLLLDLRREAVHVFCNRLKTCGVL